MKWTHKSIRRLCRTLRRQGFSIGRTTVRRLLHQRKYCLRTNRKRLAGTHDKDRDRQFRYLVRQRHRYLKHGWPVISVDRKRRNWWAISRTLAAVGDAGNGPCWTMTFGVMRSGWEFPMGSMTRAGTLGLSSWVCPTTRRHLQSLPFGSGGFRWSEALFKGQALADRGGWRRIERNSELAVESGTASVGGRISSHHCCIPYPAGSFEVESDRSSDVQPDQ